MTSVLAAPALPADPGERARAVARWAEAAREELRALHRRGAGGVELVRRWTRAVDGLVIALFRAAGARPDAVCLVALGGYGRAELSPASDLDLLILHRAGDDPKAVAEALCYPLWDAGFEVQAVTRTVEENLAVARADLRSRTSLLEARRLWGAEDLWAELEDRVIAGEILSGDRAGFVEAKWAELEARHARYGDTVYLLEPQVKEGPGGLRDIHTAEWVVRVAAGTRDLDEACRRLGVPSGEREGLEACREFLLRVRNQLHLAAGRRDDRLGFERQDEAAGVLGFEDGAGVPGVERFLQAYHATARRVMHLTRTVIRRARADGAARGGTEPWREPGVGFRDGEVVVDPGEVVRRPIVLLAAFEAAQETDRELSPQALEAVRENLHRVDDRFRRDPEAVARFLGILRAPRRVATTLMTMHEVGFLDRFIPEFARIHGRCQRDLYHVYPVDVHSLFAVRELRRLARGEYEGAFPVLTERIRRVRHPEVLYLAALLHDVGKGSGGGHAERGAEAAVAVADRMGFDPEQREYLVFLVRRHLLMARTAQARDLDDPDVIAAFAREVGDLESLDLLYLLTFADIRAVGPGAWTPWKGVLLDTLYLRTRVFLETGGEAGPRRDDPARAAAVSDRLREAAAGRVPPDEVEAFLAGVETVRYLLANPLETLLAHLEAFAGRHDDPVVRFREVPEEGHAEAVLVTRDRPGLFARVAGVLAAHRLNILSAVLNSRTDGWVVDVFRLERAGDGPDRWPRCETALRAVLRGEEEFGAIEERLRRRGLRRPLPEVPPEVRVENEASRRYTVVELKAADRLGLLYDVARTLADEGCTIRIAKITTSLRRAVDAFYVEDANVGGKILDPDRVERLRKALERAAGGPA